MASFVDNLRNFQANVPLQPAGQNNQNNNQNNQDNGFNWGNVFDAFLRWAAPRENEEQANALRSLNQNSPQQGNGFNTFLNWAAPRENEEQANALRNLNQGNSNQEETKQEEPKREEPKQEETKQETSTQEAQGNDDWVEYTYKPNDNFGKVIVDLGLNTDKGLWGKDGDVAHYTQQLIDQGVWKDNHNINGNIPVGTKIRLKRRKI